MYCKDKGLYDYYYTFNCENNTIKNYLTEKIVDGILAECLTFYWGCPNISEILDDKSFVYLDLDNFEDDYNKITQMLNDFEWNNRIEYIKKEKHNILNHKQFFPLIENIIYKD